MLDTSCVAVPIRDHAFFEQTVFQRQVRNTFLERSGLAAQFLDLVGGGSTGCIASKPTLSRFHELLGPRVIEALSNAFLAAQLGCD